MAGKPSADGSHRASVESTVMTLPENKCIYLRHAFVVPSSAVVNISWYDVSDEGEEGNGGPVFMGLSQR